jgi:DNA-binding NarL/FixJ family response regulator
MHEVSCCDCRSYQGVRCLGMSKCQGGESYYLIADIPPRPIAYVTLGCIVRVWIPRCSDSPSGVKVTKMATIRILLLDHQTIIRVGLRMLIDALPEMEVVGEVQDSPAALALMRETTPDLIIMDISYSSTSGIEAVKQFQRECPYARVLILSESEDPTFVRSALTAGGLGYITKRASVSDLLTAIHTLYQGRPFVDPTLSDTLLQDFLTKKTIRSLKGEGDRHSLLSPRERQVLILLAQGYTNREVAEQIYVSIKTVETHRARIAKKLQLRNRAELIHYAHESGLLSTRTD